MRKKRFTEAIRPLDKPSTNMTTKAGFVDSLLGYMHHIHKKSFLSLL